MSDQLTVTIKKGDHASINRLLNWVDANTTKRLYSTSVTIVIDPRTNSQNSKMWPMLKDFETSRVCISGRDDWSKEEWKCFLMSAFNSEVPVPGINGEPVNLGTSTRHLSKKRFSEFIEFIYAMGTQYGVKWSEEALAIYDEWANRY